jgi:hypothetical protein
MTFFVRRVSQVFQFFFFLSRQNFSLRGQSDKCAVHLDRKIYLICMEFSINYRRNFDRGDFSRFFTKLCELSLNFSQQFSNKLFFGFFVIQGDFREVSLVSCLLFRVFLLQNLVSYHKYAVRDQPEI